MTGQSKLGSKFEFKLQFRDVLREGAQTRVVVSIPESNVRQFVLRKGTSAKIQPNGYRPGKAPAALVYRQRPSYFDSQIVDQLKRSRNARLRQLLRDCVTPPSYTAMRWDGKSEFEIEIRFIANPVPKLPGGRYAGIADARNSAAIDLPQPGGASLANFLPAQVKSLGDQGFHTGLQLGSAGDFHLVSQIPNTQGKAGFDVPDPTPQLQHNLEPRMPIGASGTAPSPHVDDPAAKVAQSQSAMQDHVKRDAATANLRQEATPQTRTSQPKQPKNKAADRSP